jgi:pimeloyl-ACP methyl ester carboxylesterase
MSEKTVVILIHGIRTAAWWQNRVASIIEREPHVTVIPLKYGYFDLIRFLCPFGFCRNGPVERIRKQLQGIRDDFKDYKFVVFAHSYGTYVLSRILLENPRFMFDRVILCGSIIRNNFDWDRVQNQILTREENKRDAIINECGTRDVWPAFANSVSWGYGATGTYGFGVQNVRDRFHPIKHSGFFDDKFVESYWVPAVRGKPIDFSSTDREGVGTPAWFAILRLPLRWLIVLGTVALIFGFFWRTSAREALEYARERVEQAREVLDQARKAQETLCGSMAVTNTEQRTGYDGTLYDVHYDFTRGPEQTDGRACGREIWITRGKSHPLFGSKSVYLVDGYKRRLSSQYYTENADGTLKQP